MGTDRHGQPYMRLFHTLEVTLNNSDNNSSLFCTHRAIVICIVAMGRDNALNWSADGAYVHMTEYGAMGLYCNWLLL
jgi:hypothetical protein